MSTNFSAHAPGNTDHAVACGTVIAVMDAQCGFCARGAHWIAHGDRAARFRIVPMQSALGARLLSRHGLDPGDPASWLLLADDRSWTSTDAIIEAGQRLGGHHRWLAALKIVPRPLRDGLYRLVARNRYRFMGRADLCAMPDPEVQKRLLR